VIFDVEKGKNCAAVEIGLSVEIPFRSYVKQWILHLLFSKVAALRIKNADFSEL